MDNDQTSPNHPSLSLFLTITWGQSECTLIAVALVNLFQIIHANFLISHLSLQIGLINIVIM
jgi:hypothetical protein